MAANSPKITGPKKPYVRPEIRKVSLPREEVVLGACKSPGGAGAGPRCELCGIQLGS
jgi:hypothetical protein